MLAGKHGMNLAVVSSSSAVGLVGAAKSKDIDKLQRKIAEMELKRRIRPWNRWKVDSPDFIAATKVLKEREVQRCVMAIWWWLCPSCVWVVPKLCGVGARAVWG